MLDVLFGDGFARRDGFARQKDATRLVLVSVLLIDAILIFLHLAARGCELVGWFEAPDNLNLGYELGVASVWVYGKTIFIGALTFSLALRYPRQGFFAFTLLFCILFMDDFFEFHEATGRLLEPTLGRYAILGLRPRDIGELTAFLVILAAAVVAFIVVFRRASAQHRPLARRILILIAILGFFGVGVDMLHVMSDNLPGIVGYAVQGLVGTLEDGGEMVMFSLILIAFLRHLYDSDRVSD